MLSTNNHCFISVSLRIQFSPKNQLPWEKLQTELHHGKALLHSVNLFEWSHFRISEDPKNQKLKPHIKINKLEVFDYGFSIILRRAFKVISVLFLYGNSKA